MNAGNTPSLSIVIPVRNEERTLPNLWSELERVLEPTGMSYELVVVNDGSSDGTLEVLLEKQRGEPRLRIVDLTRNFGKEAALTAGLHCAKGEAVIAIDADLQDPPEVIPEMLEKWRAGYDMVVAVRNDRASDGLFKRACTNVFYRLINRLSDTYMQPNAGDYRLMDRAVVEAFRQLPERTRFNKGLFAWLGFRQAVIEHVRPPRVAGTSQWKFRKLVNFAIDGLTSFSAAPLRIWGFLGMIVAAGSFLYGMFVIARTLIQGSDVPGYPSLLAAVTFLGGLNMMGIGVLGEYVARVFVETKQRPLYLVRKVYEHERPRVRRRRRAPARDRA